MSLFDQFRLRSFTKRAATPATAENANESRDTVDSQVSAQALGLWGEGIAADYLRGQGMEILGQRVRLMREEIDIVAVRPVRGLQQLVFVEVKTRSSDILGGGRAALDARKRHALCRAAAHYLRRIPRTPFRFDLIEVIGNPSSPNPPTIRHFEQAFAMEKRYVYTALQKRKR